MHRLNCGLLVSAVLSAALTPMSLVAQAAAFAFTQSAGPVTTNSATLNGMAVPNGLATVAWFEWGMDANYGNTTQPVAVGGGTGVVRVSAPVTNLAPGSAYHYRIVASNSAGITGGATCLLATGHKVSVWGKNSEGQTNLPAALGDIVGIAAGNRHSLVLKPDGTVRIWGTFYGVAPELTDAVAIAGGQYHALALKADGTVAAWGSPNLYGEVTVPPSLAGVASIACGYSHNLALGTNGSVISWGSNNSGQTNIPVGLSNVVAIAAGTYHSLALRADGTVTAWGWNSSGQTNVPAGLSNVVAIAGGHTHSLALKSDGSVLAWGESAQTKVPPDTSDVVAIAAGAFHSMALRRDGRVVAWGDNAVEQTNLPPSLSHVTAIAAGTGHSLALRPNLRPVAISKTTGARPGQDALVTLEGFDGDLDALAFKVVSLPNTGALYQYTSSGRGARIVAPNTPVSDPLGRLIFAPTLGEWGDPVATFNFVASDGREDSAPAPSGVSVVKIRPFVVTQAAAPVSLTSATINGMVLPNALPTTAWFEWGVDSNFGHATSPIDAGDGLRVVRVSAPLTGLAPNTRYQARLVASNSVGRVSGAIQTFFTGFKALAWGSNGSGQTNVPTAGWGCGDWVATSCGQSHNLVLQADGTVTAWGDNSSGQLKVPTGLSNVVAIAAGGTHSLALKGDGTVTSWGDNASGQTNIPQGLGNVVAIAGGGDHNLALKVDGTVTAWGANDSGQLNTPVGLSNVVAIAAGTAQSLALKADGTVLAWGEVWGGAGVPAGLSNVVAIAQGGAHALALKENQTVVAWGKNTSGQASVPAGLSNVVAIAGGKDHSLALTLEGIVAAWGDAGSGRTNVPAGLSNVVAIAGGGWHSLAAIPNVVPITYATTTAGLPGHDQLVTLRGNDFNGDELAFRVATLPVAGALYQYTPEGRGDLIAMPDTPLKDPSGRLYFAPAPDGLGDPYASFTYQANDGCVDSPVTSVSVRVAWTPPFVSTQPAGPVIPTGGTLNGMVVPNGQPAWAWFEWGTNTSLGQRTAATDVGSGMTVVRVNAQVTNLTPGTIHVCRLVASNTIGLTYGQLVPFTTGSRVLAWGSNTSRQTNVPPTLYDAVGIASGNDHVVALRRDGSVVAWGTLSYGATNVPAGLSNVVAVAAGGYHNLALSEDGTVRAWGRNTSGQTNVPPGLSDVVAVAAGGAHSLALKSDGTVIAWGSSAGQTDVPAGLSNVVAIAGGGSHSLALKCDGGVVAWGSNTSGQTNVPVDLSDVVAIAAGDAHSLALKRDGTVVAWGLNNYQQAKVPSGLGNVVAIGAGANHSLAVRADGTVAAWGNSSYGQATVAPGLSDMVQAVGGNTHSAVLLHRPRMQWTHPATEIRPTSARLNAMCVPAGVPSLAWFEWGDRGGYGQTTAAQDIGSSTRVVAVSAAVGGLLEGGVYQYRVVLSNETGVVYGFPQLFTTGGSLKVAQWGRQIGIPPGQTNIVAVEGGVFHGLALKSDGTVVAWGANNYNETNVPPSLRNVVQVSSWGQYSLALRADGTVAVWGVPSQNLGQTNLPPTLTNVVSVAAGWQHALALRADGTVVAWGDNRSGQRQVPAGLSNVVAVTLGDFNSLALKSDGTVQAWGSTSYGWQKMSGLGNVVAIAGGAYHCVALKADGTVVAWGDGSLGFGQTNVPPGLSNVIAIAAGSYYGLALKSDGTVVPWGTVVAWGANPSGQTNVPVGLGNVVAIAGGDYHGVALAPNVPPQVSARTLTNAVNCDLVVTANIFDPNNDPLAYRVVSLPTHGSLFQNEEGVRGAVIGSPGTVITDPMGRIIFVPGLDEAGFPYAMFDIIANDGEADSLPAAVTVNIIPPPAVNVSGAGIGADGTFSLSFAGFTNATYRVWASTNLTHWSVLGSARQTGPGLFHLSDAAATNWPQRFYRITAP